MMHLEFRPRCISQSEVTPHLARPHPHPAHLLPLSQHQLALPRPHLPSPHFLNGQLRAFMPQSLACTGCFSVPGPQVKVTFAGRLPELCIKTASPTLTLTLFPYFLSEFLRLCSRGHSPSLNRRPHQQGRGMADFKRENLS